MARTVKVDLVATIGKYTPAVEKAASSTDNLRDKAERFARGRYDATLTVRTEKADREVGAFATRLNKKIRQAVESLPDVKLGIDANTDETSRRINQIRRELESLSNQRIGIDVDAGDAQRRVADLSRELRTLATQSPDVQISADTAAAAAALGAVSGQVDRLDGRTAKVNVKVDGADTSIVGIAALGRALKTLGIPAAVFAATPALVSLGSSAVQASAGVALLPAVLGSVGVAAGTLVVGLDGVGDTLAAFGKAQDAAAVKAIKTSEGLTTEAAKAEYAYRQLSDAGRGLVDSLREQGPAWTDLKLDVQEKLLTGVGSQVSALGDHYLPVLRTALGETGTSFNTAFAMSADFLNLPSTVTDISVATGNVTTGLDNASRAAKPLLAAFVDLYVVGSEFMPALGQSTADVAERFADFIEEARKTGQLKGWIQDSIDVLNQLGRITGNVGGILGSSFDAVDRSGKSFLTTLEEMTERLDTTLDTPEGGAALQEFFTTTRELTRGFIAHLVQLWPTIQAGAGAFAALVREGAPLATVITDLVVSGLVPLLNTIEVLSPLLGPIAVQMLAMNLAAKSLAGSAALASGAFAAFAPASVMGRMAGFRTGMDTAGLSAGVLAERLTGSAGAGERVAAAGSKVGTVASGVASTLPLAGLAAIGLGAAYDGLTTSSGEATRAMEQGGLAAQEAIKGLAQQTVAANLPLFGQGIDLITTDLAEYREGLTGVSLAQFDLAVAQNNWDVNGTVANANALTAATVELEIQQRAAADGTDTHTAAIRRQQDLLITAIEAEIRYRDAIAGVTAAVAANGIGTDLNTEAGRRNTEALNRAIEAATAHTDSMHKQGAAQGVVEMTARAQRAALYEAAVQTGMSRDEARRYVDQLYAIPGNRNTTITADTGPALAAINNFINSNAGREIVLKARADTGSITAGATPYRGRALGGVDMMAAGGVRSMRRDVAQVVPPNQPVLMGDRMRGREYFLPDDNSPRTMAIGARWASDRGLRLIPMARGGMIQAEDGSWVPPSFYADPVTKPSQKRLDYLAGKGKDAGTGGDPRKLKELEEAARLAAEALEGLREDGLTPLGPAFVVVDEAVDTATTGMTGSIGALRVFSDANWTGMAARVGAEVGTMTGPHFGLLNLGHRLTETSTAQLQALTNASWANMAATTGQQVGTITGPIFGGLHAGMFGVEQHGATMVSGWTGELARMRAAAADPIRWVMQHPLGPPGIAASWNTLDDQFKLGKRVHPPAPNFAAGGAVHGPGTTTSDSIEARLSRDEHVWTAPEVAGAGGHEQVAGMREAARRGVLKYYRDGGPVPGFAAGGPVYQHLFGLVRGRFPQASLNSGYRAGDPGQHGKGKAVDLGQQGRSGGRGHPYLADMNRWVHDTYGKGTRALIYSGAGDDRPDLLNGRPHPYGAATDAGHKDHVHWDVNNISDLVGGGLLGGIGGAGGGAAFDPGPAVEAAFKRTYGMISDMQRFFGDSAFAAGTQGVARQSADAVKAKAMEAIAATMGAAGLGPLGAGAAFYVGEISRAAKARGMGVDGATIGTATALVESNLKMYANRKVPASMSLPHDAVGSDHDSVGLFQQRQAGWGTLEQRMNPYASAGMFFDRLARFNWRAMDPGAAAQRVQVSAFPGRYAGQMGRARGLVSQHGGTHDDGGDWPPNTWALNRSGQTEHVLQGPERTAFLRLVETITTQRPPAVPRAVPIPAASAVPVGSGGGGEVTQNFYVAETTNPESTAAKISRRQAFASRLR